MIHLRALPGAPRFDGDFEAVIGAAVSDARACEDGGADALIIENFGDVPFTRGAVAPVTIAAMAAAGRAVTEAVSLPVGFNVLRNDAIAALGLCAACRGSFVRVNVLAGSAVTDQGIIEGDAYQVLRERQAMSPGARILADVHVKHAVPLGVADIGLAARDTLDRGLADALIVSGTGTGITVDCNDLRRVREACPRAIIYVGSGATADNAAGLLQHADGLIVGSALKEDATHRAPISTYAVRRMRVAIDDAL